MLLKPTLVDVEEGIHRVVDRLDVARGQQVEKEAARDRDTQRGVSACQPLGHTQPEVDFDDRVEPVLDDPVKQLDRVRAGLQSLSAQLEEQTLVGPELGV